MSTTAVTDNTIYFERYNSGHSDTVNHCQNATKQGKKNVERRQLQQVIMQLLIDANCGLLHNTHGGEQWIEYHSGRIRLIHLNDIAECIRRSPESTRRFLRNHNDDMWIDYSGNKTLWYTPFHILPARLLW